MQTNTKELSIKQDYGASCRQMFWPMLAVFYAMFVVRNVLSVAFPIFLYLAWIAVMALVFNDTEIKALIISFIPLVPGFQSKYAVLVCMIFLLIKYIKRLRVPLFVFIVLFFMFWEYLHLSEGYSSTAEYLSGFAPLMCLAVVVCLPTKHEDISFFSRVLAVSLAVGSLILLANTVLGSQQSLISLIQEGFRLGAVEEAESYQITYNANGLGYLCNLVIASLLINVYFKRAKKIDYFLMAFAIVIGCLTVSRTFLLCLAGTFVLYILLQEKNAMHKVKVFAAVVVILIFAVVALKIVAPNIIDNYVDRFRAEDITGGRAFLNDFYNELITSSPKNLWYGIGIQNINLKIWQLKGVEVNNPHNGYQQMLVAWGVVGLVLMMLFILFMALYARKKNPRAPLMCYLPLILLLINILAGQLVTSGSKLLSLVFIYLMICNGGKGTVKKLNGTENDK